MPSILALPVFLLITIGGGVLIGFSTPPGEWYAALEKPSFNPPGWVFGPVWTVLYAMIGVAGWLTWRTDPRSAAMALWVLQMLLNFVWSPVFFGAQQIGSALAIILLLLATIIAFIALSWRSHRTSALLLLPYAAWASFASVLNGAIYMLNP